MTLETVNPSITASPPESDAGPLTCDLQSATPKRRLQGKIPSLPKAQRDAINALLLDGATYATVIDRMVKHIAIDHLSLAFRLSPFAFSIPHCLWMLNS